VDIEREYAHEASLSHQVPEARLLSGKELIILLGHDRRKRATREDRKLTRAALFVRWVLGIVVIIFLLLGVSFIFIPTNMIGAMDITAEPGKALADIRAVYGGLNLAFGILLGACFLRKQWAAGLAISTLAWTCLLAGRLVGIVWDAQARDVLTIGLFASEVLGAVLSAVAWFLVRQPEPAEPPAAASQRMERRADAAPTPDADSGA
jgi:hypothetical protein